MITVRKALRLEKLRGCTLVAGHQGADRQITCIDTMEIPDISSWLKKGELLLTTAYAIKNDEQALITLIESLSRAEAAALAIKTRFIGGVSETVRQCADALGMPLIVLPEQMPFIEISNALIGMILEEQNLLLGFSNSIHEKFMHLELEGSDIEKLASMLHRLLECPVLITDSALSPLAGSPDNEAFTTFLSGSEVSMLLRSQEISTSIPLPDNEVLTARRVYYKGRIRGFILIKSLPAIADDLTGIVLDHAATSVALEFARGDALSQQIDMLQSSLLIDLIMGRVGGEEQAALRARQLNWLTPPFSLLLFGTDTATSEDSVFPRQIADTIAHLLAQQNISATLLVGAECYYCLVHAFEKQKLAETAALIRDCILSVIGIRLTAGLVFSLGSYLALEEADKDASDALKIGKATGVSVVCIDDVRLEQMALHAEDNPYLRNFVHNTAGRLLQYDKEHGTQLVQTTQALVQHMGVRTQTAEALYLHRNTLLQRIRKIEAITGCDLSRSQNLQDLGLALRFAVFE